MKKICRICLRKFFSQGLLGHYRWKHNLSAEEARVLISPKGSNITESISPKGSSNAEKPPTYLPMEKKEASKPNDPCGKDDVFFSLPLDWGSEGLPGDGLKETPPNPGDSLPSAYFAVVVGVLAVGWLIFSRLLKPEVVQEVGAVITSFADKFGVNKT